MKIGIDYSLSSPGICVNTSEGEFKYEDCTFYFLTNTKKYNTTFKEKICIWTSAVEFVGSPHQLYTSEPERYSQIADWVVDIIKFLCLIGKNDTNYSNRRLLIWFYRQSISYRRESRTTQIQTQDGVWLGLYSTTAVSY